MSTAPMPKLKKGLLRVEERTRCSWPGQDAEYIHYHDEEWGRPVVSDVRLYEKICLEGFQAGLSWLTILRKRENFRAAFAGFDPAVVAKFSEPDVERLLQDAGIVRHRGKIEATINNASRALELADEFGSLAAYFWAFEPTPAQRPRRMTHAALMKLTQTDVSKAISKDLRKRGWSFVGPTTCYAFMQAMGLVNDHIEGCEWRDVIEAERKQCKRP
ncbi:MAG: DNA-3-methyladenine glycosylase I [Planctomycetota bacterium]|jgi:DNA-3-methyladenine glycosylase I